MEEFDQLHPSLQYHVVNSLGWNTLRPTQLAAIAPIQEGSHCLLLAPTAGGKTEAAAIPMLSRMLEPAREGGKARWTGGARSLGRDVCQAIRTVLATGAPPIVRLSLRAKDSLRALADELPISTEASFLVARSDALTRTWTFAGTRANRTWARQASTGGQKVRFDALFVHAPSSLLGATPHGPLTLTAAEIATFAESIKFSACVPNGLLVRTIVARNFEATADQSN